MACGHGIERKSNIECLLEWNDIRMGRRPPRVCYSSANQTSCCSPVHCPHWQLFLSPPPLMGPLHKTYRRDNGAKQMHGLFTWLFVLLTFSSTARKISPSLKTVTLRSSACTFSYFLLNDVPISVPFNHWWAFSTNIGDFTVTKIHPPYFMKRTTDLIYHNFTRGGRPKSLQHCR